MRVLHIARQFYPSVAGVERFTQDLCRYLLQRGIQSDVLTLNRCFYQPGVLPAQDSVEGIRIIRIPFWGRQRLFFAPGVLRFVSDYDLLHIHNVDFFSDFLLLTRFYHRKPIIVSTHGGFFHTRRLAWLKKVYFHTITRRLLRRADKVIASSIHDRDLFISVMPGVLVIENGVDFTRLTKVRKAIEPGLLLYVGRLVSNKRVDNLIRALAFVRPTVPHAHLALIGCDFEGIAQELLALADDLGVRDAVDFVGQVSDGELAGWLARAHLFVSASEYEGFGISVLEAMSTGTLAVVNPLPSFLTFIQDGENGFLADFARPEDAAQTLVYALQITPHDLAVLGERARQTAARYAWENVVERFITVYQEIIDERCANPAGPKTS